MKPEWISVSDRKPDNDLLVYVTNERGGSYCFIAIYQKKDDIFRQYEPSRYNTPCVDVTHWYPLPTPIY